MTPGCWYFLNSYLNSVSSFSKAVPYLCKLSNGIQRRCAVPRESTHPFNISPTVSSIPSFFFLSSWAHNLIFLDGRVKIIALCCGIMTLSGALNNILGRSDPWYDWVWTAVPWKPFSVSFLSPSLSCLPVNLSIHHVSRYLSLQFPPPLELFFLTCHKPGDRITRMVMEAL